MRSSELETKAMAPLKGARRWFVGVAIVLVVLLLAMPVALWEDGGSTGPSPTGGHWGFHLSTFVFFLGIALSGVLVSVFGRVLRATWAPAVTRIAEVLSVSAAIVALVSVVIAIGDLGTLLDTILYGDITNPVVWQGIVVALYLIAVPGVLYFALVPDLHRVALRARRLKYVYRILSYGYVDTEGQRTEVRRLAMAVAGLSAGVLLAVHLVIAHVVAGIADQPSWNNALAGPAFVTYGLLAGFSITVILFLVFHRGFFLHFAMRPEVLAKVGSALAVVIALGAVGFAWSTLGHEDADLVWNEENGPITVIVLLTGFVLPIAALGLIGRTSTRGLMVSSGLVLTTVWARAYLIVIPGLTAHDGALDTGVYVPTLSEWGLLAGYVAMFGLVALVLLRLLPFVSVWEVDEDRFLPDQEVAEA